jgi:hypothetical protein
MNPSNEFEREDDGRWIAEIMEIPGVMVYGAAPGEAKARALALRVIADRSGPNGALFPTIPAT